MTMREKIARALAHNMNINPDVFIGVNGGLTWLLDAADAVLDALPILPCDVILPPCTVIRAGCSVETLLAAMEQRTKDGLPKRFEKPSDAIAEASVLGAGADPAYIAGRAEAFEEAAKYMETTLPHLSLQEYAAAIRALAKEPLK